MSPSFSCRFFGTTSIYIDDGKSRIFIDAFLSRPSSQLVVSGKIQPDHQVIDRTLAHGQVQNLDAIFVAHSHYDHAMDAPEVIKRKGGTLYGSESTLNVGRGLNLPEDSMVLFDDGKEYTIGDFHVKVIKGIHSPHDIAAGNIVKPLHTPAKVVSYCDGGCFSFLIEHPSGSIFVHPSANFVSHKLEGVKADVLFLSIGLLEMQAKQFQSQYWQNTVEVIRPRLIIPVHWDDFSKELSAPLPPLPNRFGDFEVMRQKFAKADQRGWHVHWLDAFESISLPLVE